MLGELLIAGALVNRMLIALETHFVVSMDVPTLVREEEVLLLGVGDNWLLTLSLNFRMAAQTI